MQRNVDSAAADQIEGAVENRFLNSAGVVLRLAPFCRESCEPADPSWASDVITNAPLVTTVPPA